ncbi:DUF502 domain-containing protein [Carboxydothermus hydrogenoformans]|uniref:Transporter n=1 Tax=Carboxydothermus hydrogenoformans (strain ATCC BAA-161 / DSM 6008 / Z-2901) TaxID=246194 RepID=Q3AEZ4_CARHZ|nr:DUF502 domain-containing protein [Carboxydothermus hydrogenoformans]ABB15573.1 conserved hypothetical protein [Carboxydothermus hydrogenoformans Z-2901]
MAGREEGRDIFKKLGNYFLTGLAVITPAAITIYILFALFSFFDRPLRGFFAQIFGIDIPGLGVLTVALLVPIVGMLATNFIGRKILKKFEQLFIKIPVTRSLYKTSKQLIETFLHPERDAFKSVVLARYPKDGSYALGFITGSGFDEINEKTREKLLPVFLPTTPNPTSGWLLYLPEKDIIPLNLSVEDALKIIVSGGIVQPERGEEKDEL